MRRPGSIAATGPAAAWNSGAYVYDGTGNIRKIGPAWYTYDKVNRLTAGHVNALTNHLSGGTYDDAGNLAHWNGAVYTYDAFNQMVRMTSGAQDWAYVYTAGDERLWSYDLTKQEASRWALRDLSGQVLREYLNDDGTWTIGTDYIHRDGQLLAAETRLGRRHFHLDHLGTPRLITNSVGYKKAYHAYYPFGEEATVFDQDGERMKFTGHERDLANPAGAGDDLDYMHARHYSPVTGRFLGVDPSRRSTIPEQPQSWNRYAYTIGNPLKYYDPDGQVFRPATDDPEERHRQYEMMQAMMEIGLPGPSAMAAGPRTAGLLLSRIGQFVSRILGGADDAAGATHAASRLAALEGRAAALHKVIRPDGGLNLSVTVEKQLMGIAAGKDRRFIPVHSILDAIGSGTRVADPQKVANQFLYTAEATYKGTKGVLEVIVNEKTGQVVHVLFRSVK